MNEKYFHPSIIKEQVTRNNYGQIAQLVTFKFTVKEMKDEKSYCKKLITNQLEINFVAGQKTPSLIT